MATVSSLKYPARLESNNPAAYGIVKAVEISGHRSVQSLDDLYSIADCMLSDTLDNENNDAIGQEWYVANPGSGLSSAYYRLVSWENRNNALGWQRQENSSQIIGDLDNITVNNYPITGNPVLDGSDILLDGYVTSTSSGVELNISSTDSATIAIGKLEKKINDNQSSIENMIGEPNGIAPLNQNGQIASQYLPSYVDDVLEYDSSTAFPATGESGKIYIDTTANLTYRWTGTQYAEIPTGLGIGTGDGTAYPGQEGNANRTAIQSIPSPLVSSIDRVSANATTNEIDVTSWSKSGLNYNSSTSLQITIPAATQTTAGVISGEDKMFIDGIRGGNLPMPTVAITGTWTFYLADGTEVAASSINPQPNATNPTIERGYQASFSGTYHWTPGQNTKNPTIVSSNSNWDDLPSSGEESETYTSSMISSNTTIRASIEAPKTGLMVSGSNVVPASGNDVASATRSISFSHRKFFGLSSTQAITEDILKGFSNSSLGTSKSCSASGVSPSSYQYVVYAYPSSLGTLTGIAQGAYEVISAFTRQSLNITNAAGSSVPLYVYVSNNPGAFVDATLSFS